MRGELGCVVVRGYLHDPDRGGWAVAHCICSLLQVPGGSRHGRLLHRRCERGPRLAWAEACMHACMRGQVSTGEGKARVLDEKQTTVYKRALDQEYKLKLKASRSIFTEINKRYPTMPFTASTAVSPWPFQCCSPALL